MIDPRTDVLDSRRMAILWTGLLLAPAACLLNLELGYMLVHPACLQHGRIWLHVLHLLMVLLALGGWWAARLGRDLESRPAAAAADVESRSQFMGTLGMWTSGLFALVILAQSVPTFVLHPCQ
jgi:hypothetical protein